MRRREFLTTIGGIGAAAALADIIPHVASAVDASAANAPAVTHEADVVVAGASEGGLGGCMAAIAAARRGSKVILLESAGHIGLHIPISLGVVIGIPGWKPTMKEGLFKELAERVSATGQHNEFPMTRDQLMEK